MAIRRFCCSKSTNGDYLHRLQGGPVGIIVSIKLLINSNKLSFGKRIQICLTLGGFRGVAAAL